MPPPDLPKLLSSLKRYYQNLRTSMEHDDDLFHQKYERFFTADYDIDVYKAAIPANIIESYRDQMRTDAPTVDVRVWGSSRESEKKANKLQQWGYGLLRKERMMGAADPNLICAFHLLLRGAACKKIVVDNRAIGNKLKGPEAAEFFPYVIRALDPVSVFPAPGLRKPLHYIIEVQKRRIIDMWEDYPEWGDPKGRKMTLEKKNNPAREVEWVEYWSAPLMQGGKQVEPGYYIVEADGESLWDTRENPYGIVPYIYEYGGFGFEHNDGDPAHMGKGLLTDRRGELVEYVRLMTAMTAQTMMYVFPTLIITGDVKRAAKQFGIGPGRIIERMPGGGRDNEPHFMETPPPNQNILAQIEKVEANLSRIYNPALLGIRPPGVQYGVHQAQLTGQALTLIRPAREALDTMATQTLNMEAYLLHVMKFTMTTEGSFERAERTHTITSADCTHHTMNVTFEAADPTLNDRMLQTGELLRGRGDISRRTFWRQFAKHVVEDPDAEEAELIAEQLIGQLIASGAGLEILMGGGAEGVEIPALQEGAERAGESVGTAVEAIEEQIAGTPGATVEAMTNRRGVT